MNPQGHSEGILPERSNLHTKSKIHTGWLKNPQVIQQETYSKKAVCILLARSILDDKWIHRVIQKETYSKEKLRHGILKACEKTNISEQEVDEMIDAIEAIIRTKDEITSKFIGSYVLNKLKKKDEVAYLRFASVHKSINNIESFEKELQALKK